MQCGTFLDKGALPGLWKSSQGPPTWPLLVGERSKVGKCDIWAKYEGTTRSWSCKGGGH